MKTEKKLTALQEFINRLKNDFGFVVSNNVTEMYLEKEKQQIIDACNQAEFEDEDNFGICDTITKGEQYYNETFKND